jgi:hypothetical protein
MNVTTRARVPALPRGCHDRANSEVEAQRQMKSLRQLPSVKRAIADISI